MKAAIAIAILYVIAVIQAVGTFAGFAISYNVLQGSLYEAGKMTGQKIIEICDQRYVQK